MIHPDLTDLPKVREVNAKFAIYRLEFTLLLFQTVYKQQLAYIIAYVPYLFEGPVDTFLCVLKENSKWAHICT